MSKSLMLLKDKRSLCATASPNKFFLLTRKRWEQGNDFSNSCRAIEMSCQDSSVSSDEADNAATVRSSEGFLWYVPYPTPFSLETHEEAEKNVAQTQWVGGSDKHLKTRHFPALSHRPIHKERTRERLFFFFPTNVCLSSSKSLSHRLFYYGREQ